MGCPLHEWLEIAQNTLGLSSDFQFFRTKFQDKEAFNEDIKTLAYYTYAWAGFYLLIKYIPIDVRINGKIPTLKENVDLRNRVVSFFHGIVAMLMGTYHWLFLRTECGELNTPLQKTCMMFSMSYFIYDFIAMYMEGILDTAMTIHHPLCVLGLAIPLIENVSGNFCMLAIFISEISNPPMTLRHILRLTGKRYTKLYEFAEVSFILLFFFGRVIVAAPICVQTFKCETNHIFLKTTCAALQLYSFFFLIQMKNTLSRRYKEVLSRKRLGIQIKWFEPLS